MHSQRPSPDPFPLTPPPAVGPNDGRRNNFFHCDGPARVGNARMQMPACQLGQWGVVYVARRPQVRPGQCASAQFEVWASGMCGGGARLRQRCDKGARVVCRSFFSLHFETGADDSRVRVGYGRRRVSSCRAYHMFVRMDDIGAAFFTVLQFGIDDRRERHPWIVFVFCVLSLASTRFDLCSHDPSQPQIA